MHAAFLNLPSPGHVYPTLGIVAELAARGHRVSYATTERMMASVADAGARPVQLDLGLRQDVRPATGTRTGVAGGPRHMKLTPVQTVGLMTDWARRAIPTLNEQFEADPPDVVIHDGIELGWYGRLLAAGWDAPAVETWPVFVWHRHWALLHPSLLRHAGRVRRELRELDAGASLRSVLDGRHEALRLVLTPQAFQYAARTFDDSYRFVGPCFSSRKFQGTWKPPKQGQRVVLVSMSEAVSNWPQFFQLCIDAFRGSALAFVISTGRYRIDELNLGELPDNIEFLADVPFSQVLPHADLQINSAGMGATMESLAFGVPIVAIPLGFERPLIGRRVQRLGLGKRLAPGNVSAKSLRQTAEAVLGDEKIRVNVRAMQALIEAAGGPRAAADAIEQRCSASRNPAG